MVSQSGAVTGYAVAGINTLSGIYRQAANYAIPADKIQAFIESALNPKPETFREDLDARLSKFTEGLSGTKSVFPHIALFLSNAVIGNNAEFAIDECYEKAGIDVIRAVNRKAEETILGAIGYTVAWTIEDSIRRPGAALSASVKEVSGSGGEYTVVFTINNKDVSSEWIREYGNWRIKSFGTVAIGDEAAIERRQAQRETAQRMRIGDHAHIEAGYASLFDKAPAALYASIELPNLFIISSEYNSVVLPTMGFKVYFAGADFFSVGIFAGTRFNIPIGNVGLMPYLRVGFDYQHDQRFENFKEAFKKVMVFPIALMAQAGIKVTTSFVPGLFAGASFQYNLNFHSGDSIDDYKYPMKMGLVFSIGYAF